MEIKVSRKVKTTLKNNIVGRLRQPDFNTDYTIYNIIIVY